MVELTAPDGRNWRRLPPCWDVFAFDPGKERCRQPGEAVRCQRQIVAGLMFEHAQLIVTGFDQELREVPEKRLSGLARNQHAWDVGFPRLNRSVS
jgi:hypothetical protein